MAQPEQVIFKGNTNFSQEIVGEKAYQETIGKLQRWGKRDFLATLWLEDNNKYDKNAVCILIEHQVVGYFDKKTAIEYRKLLKEIGHPAAYGYAKAKIFGGEYPKYYGVALDIDPGEKPRLYEPDKKK